MLEPGALIHFVGRCCGAPRRRLAAALDATPLGFCVFDRGQRLRVCNAAYLAMYNLSPKLVRPGCSLDALLELRAGNGTLDQPAEHRAALAMALARGTPAASVGKLPDGRIIRITRYRLGDGGWVSVHEDASAESRADEQRLLTHAHEQRRLWLDDFVGSFRGQAESSLATLADTPRRRGWSPRSC